MRAALLLALVTVACNGGVNAPPSKDDVVDTDTDDSAATLSISPGSIDFGAVAYGELVDETVNVSNDGGVDLVISDISVPAPFDVFPKNMVLLAGTRSVVRITVQPVSYETFATTVTIETDGEDVGTVELPVAALTITDADGDGFLLEEAGGDDCDDNDADVNPGAGETWYDDVDENCDGGNDFDQDGDGYESDVFNPDASNGGGDCQDIDPAFHPGAADEFYDNRDTNCDGSNDFDADGDGYGSEAFGRGSDCDDADPEANIDGIESLNGRDDDCDDEVDTQAIASASEYVYNADGNYDRTGYSLAIGDLNDDSYAELIVGAPYNGASSSGGSGRGGVAIFDGNPLLATGTTIDNADNWFNGGSSSDLLGNYVTVMGDHNGDGTLELAVSATGASTSTGTVYVIDGGDAMRGDTNDAMSTWTGSGTSTYFGRGIGTEIDLDADGYDELVVMSASGTSNYVSLEYGSGAPTASGSVSTFDAKFSTDGSEAAFYRNAPVGGDFDGDGYDDLLLSDGKADYGGYTDNGATWMLWGQASRYSNSSTTDIETYATVLCYGTSTSDYDSWATQLGDDWDGDGDSELWIFNSADALYVVEGGETGRSAFDPSTEAAVEYTWNVNSTDAEMIRRAGDFTGDGVDEMIVFLEDETGSYGNVELFSSEIDSGTMGELSSMIGDLTGSTDDDNANVGFGMAPMGGDIDGDGREDFAVGDPEQDSNAGQAYVLINRML